MSHKDVLNYVEFHITNVCNFNCINCNKLNNYSFSGGIQKWNDYSEIYSKWADKIDILDFSIIGGEPMTNPDYLLWFKNIADLWPNATGRITTNGYYLKPDNEELYNILKSRPGLIVKISIHNSSMIQSMIETVKQFLIGPIKIERYPKELVELNNFTENWATSYNNIRAESWPDCNTVDDWYNLPEYVKNECINIFKFSPELLAEKIKHYRLTDSNGVVVTLEDQTYFHQAAVIQVSNQEFKLHNSDVVLAHATCDAKFCHQFYNGKLHKCYLTAILPDFDQQFFVNLSDSDRELLMSYQPLSVTDSDDRIKSFVDNIRKPIPQCKFCPEQFDSKITHAEHGNKIKITKKKFL